MKTILALILSSSVAFAAPGDFLFTKIGTPNSPVLLTPVSGRVLYWNGATLGNLDIAATYATTSALTSGLAGKAPSTGIAQAAVSNLVADLSTINGYIVGLDLGKAPSTGIAASAITGTAVTLSGTQTITGSKTFENLKIESGSYSGAFFDDGTNLTANRSYTPPNNDGYVALTGQTDGKVNLAGSYLTGTLPIANGGTNAITAAAAAVAIVNGNPINPSTIGATTPGTGAFTTLSASGQSLTGSQSTNLLDLACTWNTTGNPTMIYGRVTNTASGATANLIDLGTVALGSLIKLDKAGALTLAGKSISFGSAYTATIQATGSNDMYLDVATSNRWIFFSANSTSVSTVGVKSTNGSAAGVLGINNVTVIAASSGTTPDGTKDLGLIRGGVGQWNINDGSATAANLRDLKLRSAIQSPPASITPAANGELVFEATSNTSVTVKMRGTDGTVRSVVLTLAP
jgi:hypothetical protein